MLYASDAKKISEKENTITLPQSIIKYVENRIIEEAERKQFQVWILGKDLYHWYELFKHDETVLIKTRIELVIKHFNTVGFRAGKVSERWALVIRWD